MKLRRSDTHLPYVTQQLTRNPLVAICSRPKSRDTDCVVTPELVGCDTLVTAPTPTDSEDRETRMKQSQHTRLCT
jgi:hypothetical protein